MASHPSDAYRLAEAQSSNLSRAYTQLRRDLCTNGRAHRVETFEQRLRGGKVAINMSLSACWAVLKEMEMLTAFQLAERDASESSGPAYDRALKKRLGAFYSARLEVEQLFKFHGRARYAYLYCGGDGPNYGGGECRVVLERTRRYTFSTVFAGDTIGAVFKADGTRVLSVDHLSRFATRKELRRLASVHRRALLEGDETITERRLERLLSNEKTLLEVHIHEEVSIENIVEITIADRIHADMETLVPEYNRAPRAAKDLEQFDKVRAYLNIYDMIRIRRPRIPVY